MNDQEKPVDLFSNLVNSYNALLFAVRRSPDAVNIIKLAREVEQMDELEKHNL